MTGEIAKLKELIRHSDSGIVLPSEGAHCVEFLSKKYGDLHLEELKAKVDTIGNAIDEEYSSQYSKNSGSA